MGRRLYQILQIAKQEYTSFALKSTSLLILFTLIYFLERIIFPMAEICQTYGFTVHPTEGYIHILTMELQAFIVPLMFMAFMADFPSTKTSGYFSLIRTGRITWMLGQLLFAVAMGLTYLLLLFLGCSIFLLPCAQWGGWGTFNTMLSTAQPDVYMNYTELFLPASVVAQGKPYQVCALATLLALCNLVVICLILTLFKFYGAKPAGLLVISLGTVVGFVCAAVRSPLMWLFPAAHSMFHPHFNGFFARPVCPLWVSILYFVCLIGVLTALNLRAILKCRIGDE